MDDEVSARPSFCQYCGARFSDVAAGPRLECGACGRVTYRNPAAGVAVILIEEDRVLLGRRGRGRWAGLWCIPCGYVEWDEDLRDTARREVLEETGLEVEVGEVYAAHSNFHDREKQTVGVWFRGTIRGGTLQAGDDIVEVAFFAVDDLPPLAFPTDELVLRSLRSAKAERELR
jgi:ADP-ribose pyrophosphatase YjhB (NUDIX family)